MRDGTAGMALLAAVALCVLASGCAGDLVVLKPAEPAPAFQLEDLEARATALADQKGKIVMVRFWADWCKSCRTEMPLIEEKYREYHDSGFEVLALNVRQDREAAARFARQVGISYPVLLDRDGSVAGSYGVIGLPTTFLIDRDGRILEEIIGDMNRRSLSELIDPLFERTPG